jgi:rhodanese-related sulfurtransferase
VDADRAAGSGAVNRLSAGELRARRAAGGEVVVVDVRTADARMVNPAQIPGSLWIPLAEVVERAAALPRDATIVTYCT